MIAGLIDRHVIEIDAEMGKKENNSNIVVCITYLATLHLQINVRPGLRQDQLNLGVCKSMNRNETTDEERILVATKNSGWFVQKQAFSM